MDNSEYVKRAKKAVKDGLSVDDLIKRLLELVESAEKAENELFKASSDMYAFYFPEWERLVTEKEDFIESFSSSISRKDLSKLKGISTESMGYDLSSEDLDVIYLYLNELRNISMVKKQIWNRIEEIIRSNYPNMYSIAGYEISARLIALSNGIKRLAMLPSSKVQVMGAEMSLFSGKKGDRTPKYGVIFKHERLSGLSLEKRPKAAKKIAAAISLAAKADYISKKDISEEIKDRLEKEIKGIRP
ncbi:hypothetical protein M1293_03990 [Candidatus Parvarchaeota archaeon]|nr:hypothetical protein [Candidatus Parvarchaeota archaeon]